MSFLQIDNLLDTPALEALTEWAIAGEESFGKSGVIGDASWRESRIIFSFAPWDRLFRERIAGMAPAVVWRLGLKPVRLALGEQIEAQLTVHNDGHYFKRHFDCGSETTKTRVLTYVYYFHREPCGYRGGELEIDGHKVYPRNNSIVFFPSSTWHEVHPVRCPSRIWADSRFTVNGWVRQLTDPDGNPL